MNEGRERIRAELANRPDIAHRQLVGHVVDTDHPAFASILARTGEPPMRPVFKRIAPFWES